MDLFTEGQKITLFFLKASNMVEMVCSVDKVYDDRLDLLLPQYFMRYIQYLQVGKKLTVKAFSKFGTVDFNTVIISSPLEDSFTIEMDYNSVHLTPDKEMPVIRAVETLEIFDSDTILKVKTFEISSEQIKFTTDKKFKIGDNLDCSLNLPKDYGIITFKAVVTEIDPIYDNEYTANFITITETAKQTLLYYMYKYSNDID